MPLEQSNAEDCWRPAGPLTIEQVGAARAELVAWFERPGELRFDLSAVEPCDSAGVQLLCSAVTTAAQAGRSLKIVATSAAVQAAAIRIGIPSLVLGPGGDV